MADVTLTLKNIPESLHRRLKDAAEKNRRSLNSEILVRLEAAFSAPLVDRQELTRKLKAALEGQAFVDHDLVDVFKRQGRA